MLKLEKKFDEKKCQHTALLVALSLINANLWHFQTCFKDQTQSIAVALWKNTELFFTTNSPKKMLLKVWNI